jgi:hypothetical protein
MIVPMGSLNRRIMLCARGFWKFARFDGWKFAGLADGFCKLSDLIDGEV